MGNANSANDHRYLGAALPHRMARQMTLSPRFTLALALPFALLPLLSANFQPPPGNTFNVMDFGARGDSRIATDGAMESGSATLSCAACAFSPADAGKNIYVYGADGAQYAISLGATIQAVQNSTTATLTASATQPTSGALVQIIGTDDTQAILAARDKACATATQSSPSVLSFPAGHVFTLNGRVIHPCSNLRITGPGTIMQISMATGTATGQGTSIVMFPRSPEGRVCNGGTMTPGSNVLSYGSNGKKPCNFTPADVGSSVGVAYADRDYLPLYARITQVLSNTEAVLDHAASTAVPLTNTGLGRVGTYVEIGETPMTNVEIDDITLTNVSTAYPAGSTLGIGIVAFGEDGSSFKQNVRVHDVTVETASINCLGGNNGMLDQYSFQRNTLIGCADASIYVAGWNSRGTVSENKIQNIHFPGLTPEAAGRVLDLGILIKGASNVTFAHNTITVDARLAGIAFGDWEQFRDVVEDNTIIVSARHAVTGIEGNVVSKLQLTRNTIECRASPAQQSFGISFYSEKVTEIETAGNTIRNCQVGMQFDGRGTGSGPARLKIRDNRVEGCRKGLHLENTAGVNVIQRNNLTGCTGMPFVVVGSQNGATTYVTGDNETRNLAPSAATLDRSVRVLPKGMPPPN
ncbi:MAG: right-handed parallel beta-helix repeat-containing protein [Bryobacteraceae bacterium]